jgi:predicted nucleic acid-binding protein
VLTLDANVWIAAFDPEDRFHVPSTVFLSTVTSRHLTLNGPAFVLVESACALARRAGSATVGMTALNQLRAHPLLTLQPLDQALLGAAAQLGLQHLLRGADALYAATAQLSRSQLVSWDNELIQRAGAFTPPAWLAANP